MAGKTEKHLLSLALAKVNVTMAADKINGLQTRFGTKADYKRAIQYLLDAIADLKRAAGLE